MQQTNFFEDNCTTPQQAEEVSEHSDENLSQMRHPRMS